VDTINKLFIKVDAARRHEREVTAFAAHELRTPLAGLKTQAQIALSASDNATKEGALRQILVSVDRTSRLVRQLLAIAKLDAGSETDRRENLIAGQLIVEVADSLKPDGGSISVEIDPELPKLSLRTNRAVLTLAIRSLHENAVKHTPEGGTVSGAPDGAALRSKTRVGITAAELLSVSQRFSVASTECIRHGPWPRHHRAVAPGWNAHSTICSNRSGLNVILSPSAE
jgi:two-component system sensor histidine kinase QseC